VSEARRKAEAGVGGTTSVVTSGVGGGSYFRLDQHQDQLVFGTDEDLVTINFLNETFYSKVYNGKI
jgi:hypothetical protein